jgi:hypothetical protein
MVKVILAINWVKFFSIKLWWAQVTVTPEDNRIRVFKRGTLNGLKGETPVGGQNRPISILGDKLLWKNAQKNEKKNNTSDVMNRIIPHFRPLITRPVCKPW